MQNYAQPTGPLPTPGDRWASGKLLGNAPNPCAGATQGPLSSPHWHSALRAGTEPTAALAQRRMVAAGWGVAGMDGNARFSQQSFVMVCRNFTVTQPRLGHLACAIAPMHSWACAHSLNCTVAQICKSWELLFSAGARRRSFRGRRPPVPSCRFRPRTPSVSSGGVVRPE